MAKRAKAPPGCYWRGSTLWAKAMVGGRMSWWSLDTSDPAIAKKRREAGKARLLADAKHGDAKRSLEEAIVAWEGNLTRQVANGVLGQKTETRYLVSIKQLAPYLDGKALSDIDLRLLTEIVEAREQKGVTNATIKRDLVALSSLMNFALDKGWVEHNPVLIKLPRVKEGKHLIEPPRREDIDLALSRAPGMLGPLARLAMATGARLDELVTLKRDQIDHARQQLVIVGKGNKRRVVDLRVMNAYALIAALPAYVGSPYRVLARQGRAVSQRVEQLRQQRHQRDGRVGEGERRRVSPFPLPRSAPLARDRISQGGLGDDLRSQAAARSRQPDDDRNLSLGRVPDRGRDRRVQVRARG